MRNLKFTLKPLTPFGTPVAGDTLFGHVCWAVRERDGERRLIELLEGYTSGRPFLVASDGFPEGFIPRPTAPEFVLGSTVDPSQRKRARTHRWLPADGVGRPIQRWMDRVAESDIVKTFVVSQNTINRLTGTTGTDQFAPRQVDRTFFADGKRLDVYTALDEERLSAAAVKGLLEDIGLHGYGRDATTGLGKFEVLPGSEQASPIDSNQYWLTLAPCAPDPAAVDVEGCWYLPLTRFGRHGNLAVTLGNPFKSPVLMAATGALLKSREPTRWTFHGRGLGGPNNPISAVLPDTVHQGYAPVVPLRVEGSA
jgi:CRISPR-associated protein Csm4